MCIWNKGLHGITGSHVRQVKGAQPLAKTVRHRTELTALARSGANIIFFPRFI